MIVREATAWERGYRQALERCLKISQEYSGAGVAISEKIGTLLKEFVKHTGIADE